MRPHFFFSPEAYLAIASSKLGDFIHQKKTWGNKGAAPHVRSSLCSPRQSNFWNSTQPNARVYSSCSVNPVFLVNGRPGFPGHSGHLVIGTRSALQNVISFTPSKTFWLNFNKTNKNYTFGEQILTIKYQIGLVHTHNSNKKYTNLPKKAWIFTSIQQYCYTDISVISMTFYIFEPSHSSQKRTQQNLTKVATRLMCQFMECIYI